MLKKLPWVWLAALAASTIYFFMTYGDLPGNVATHFDISGKPNGFMTKDGYLSFFVTFTLVLNGVFGASFLLVKKIPMALVNIPRKDYWTANPQRVETLHRKLGGILSLVAAYMNGVFLFTVQVVYQANTPNTALQIPLNGGVFLILLGIFCIVVFALLFLRPPPETLS